MLAWLACAAAAGPTVLVGTVGTYPVRVALPSGATAGTLTYLRKGAVLALAGSCDPGKPCVLEERGPDGAVTGKIAATWSADRLSGTWTARTALPLALRQGPDAAVVYAIDETWTRTTPKAGSGAAISVSLPRVAVVDPAIQARIDAALVPERLLGDPRPQLEADGWIDIVGFETLFDRAGLVSLRVGIEGSGATLDHSQRAVVLDVRTGAEVGPDALSPAGRTAVAAAVDAELQRRKAALEPELRERVADLRFDEARLAGFLLTEQGLAFDIAWGVPHAFSAGLDDTPVVVPWSVFAATLAAGSPLARAPR